MRREDLGGAPTECRRETGVQPRSSSDTVQQILTGEKTLAELGRELDMLAHRVHRRHGRPHVGQIQRPASNQRRRGPGDRQMGVE
jgi:hypothetical protein